MSELAAPKGRASGSGLDADALQQLAGKHQTGYRSVGVMVYDILRDAILNGTLAGAIGLGLQLWLAGILIWALGHVAAVWAAKRDPLFVEVARRHLRVPGHLSV